MAALPASAPTPALPISSLSASPDDIIRRMAGLRLYEQAYQMEPQHASAAAVAISDMQAAQEEAEEEAEIHTEQG